MLAFKWKSGPSGTARHLPFALGLFAVCALTGACDPASAFVILENDYGDGGPVIYEAFWEATGFQSPIAPGAATSPQTTVACSPTTAYVALAPGWAPTSSMPPTSYVLLQSQEGYGVALNDTVDIPVDEQTFIGDCDAGRSLSQAQADFMTQRVFPSLFVGLRYDAATCATVPSVDAGGF